MDKSPDWFCFSRPGVVARVYINALKKRGADQLESIVEFRDETGSFAIAFRYLADGNIGVVLPLHSVHVQKQKLTIPFLGGTAAAELVRKAQVIRQLVFKNQPGPFPNGAVFEIRRQNGNLTITEVTARIGGQT